MTAEIIHLKRKSRALTIVPQPLPVNPLESLRERISRKDCEHALENLLDAYESYARVNLARMHPGSAGWSDAEWRKGMRMWAQYQLGIIDEKFVKRFQSLDR